ncbi:MAG: hypothetical protein IPO08_19030 [Xanthomonadales bacterium]|nr:hypothetical protein [Xanthomonadales bacterium]
MHSPAVESKMYRLHHASVDIERATPLQKGWLAVGIEYEVALERQDRSACRCSILPEFLRFQQLPVPVF